VGKIYNYIDLISLLSDAIKTINLRHIKWLYLQKTGKPIQHSVLARDFACFQKITLHTSKYD